MKFLTFVDLHENSKALKGLVSRASESDIDFIVCAGDLSNFGKGLKNALDAFEKINKKLYIIPGNHEENMVLDKFAEEYPFLINFHHRTFKIGAYIFLGHGGGGFANQDEEFRKIGREWYGKFKEKKTVLVTHGPPAETKLDLLNNQHVGNVDYRKFIQRIKPRLVICGHLHELAGTVDTIDKTKVINPGWEGMVVELN